MSLRFDGKVAVITGAGGGLGRAYALAFADRGAKVLVNDVGSDPAGSGSSTKSADAVVEEIRGRGGEAVASHDSVEAGDKIIEAAVKAYGRVDILVNNAGILRDASLAKMTDKDWDLVEAVHLRGAHRCTRAAWPHMLKQQFGRIVNASSAAGLYGNFGQVNLSAAKSGVWGFTKSCALEGAKRNVLSNAVCPMAGTRMTETILPQDMLGLLKPEAVVPLVLYLCHESSGVNGEVIEAGGGWFAKVRIERAKGAILMGDPTPEDVRKAWDQITDFTEAASPAAYSESIAACVDAAKTRSKL